MDEALAQPQVYPLGDVIERLGQEHRLGAEYVIERSTISPENLRRLPDLGYEVKVDVYEDGHSVLRVGENDRTNGRTLESVEGLTYTLHSHPNQEAGRPDNSFMTYQDIAAVFRLLDVTSADVTHGLVTGEGVLFYRSPRIAGTDQALRDSDALGSIAAEFTDSIHPDVMRGEEPTGETTRALIQSDIRAFCNKYGMIFGEAEWGDKPGVNTLAERLSGVPATWLGRVALYGREVMGLLSTATRRS